MAMAWALELDTTAAVTGLAGVEALLLVATRPWQLVDMQATEAEEEAEEEATAGAGEALAVGGVCTEEEVAEGMPIGQGIEAGTTPVMPAGGRIGGGDHAPAWSVMLTCREHSSIRFSIGRKGTLEMGRSPVLVNYLSEHVFGSSRC